jgi:ligand-binding SRPBCC domain-containing protein
MTVHTLSRQQFVPAPVADVFAFFSSPENLSKLTPPGLGFAILTPPPIAMKQGALIDYTIRVFGIGVRWTTLITAYDPGRSFVDEQLRGPYSFWHHSHRFEEAPGGTIVRDDVRYALPFGPLGGLARFLFVKRQLDSIFDFRTLTIRTIFGGDEK